jgi:predicted transcriptional regulator
MALQGTLDTFELPDVLRLLASTKKTGRLLLHGDRGEGSVWLTDGQVTAVQTPASPDGEATAGLLDLLRARDGGFAFEPGMAIEGTGPALDVEPLLEKTEKRLAEWREIEAVVPSLHAWVALAPELPEPEVTVDAETWRLVATIGSGLTVGDLGRSLELSEMAVCRVVRDMVVLGLGAVTDAPAMVAVDVPIPAVTWEPTIADPAPTLNGHGASFEEPAPVSTPGFDDLPAFGIEPAPVPEPALDPAPAPTPTWDEFVAAEAEAPSFVEDEPVAAIPEPEPVVELEPAPVAAVPVDEDADEVARQLAMLSPRAAQAVAAAAAADTEDERDAHLDALDDGDEPINRGLLLKFLSSVKS